MIKNLKPKEAQHISIGDNIIVPWRFSHIAGEVTDVMFNENGGWLTVRLRVVAADGVPAIQTVLLARGALTARFEVAREE